VGVGPKWVKYAGEYQYTYSNRHSKDCAALRGAREQKRIHEVYELVFGDGNGRAWYWPFLREEQPPDPYWMSFRRVNAGPVEAYQRLLRAVFG
jgi:hypothetical protein